MNKKWGIYPWFESLGTEWIHPDDVEALIKESSNCKVFECIEETEEYITIRYNQNCYRVKKKWLKLVPTPRFTFGQFVKIKKYNEIVTIIDIIWHFKRKEPYYFVRSNNKKKSKRYFTDELEELEK